MSNRTNRLSIGALSVAILGVVLYVTLGTFDGGPITAPAEAVPIWANSDLSIGNRILEYFFPLLVPYGNMVKCPLEPPHDVECMAKGRHAAASTGDAPWASVIASTHDETVLQVNEQVEVVLLQPRNMTVQHVAEAPLILWIHSGGFVTGTARETYLTFVLNTLLENKSVSNIVKDAVWASVEYRLAPEYPLAAPSDCLAALEYLLSQHTVDDRHLGGGGVHIGGISAGATVATSTLLSALKAGLHINSVLVDEPAMILPERNVQDGTVLSPLNSYSFRRNAYTRIVPTAWIDWAVAAYLGRTLKQLSNTTDFELTGGAMSASEWRHSVGQKQLPPMVLMTAKGDGLHDGGVAFGRIYEEAGGVVHHVDASCSHALAFVFDKDSARRMVAAWAHLIQAAAVRRG